MSRVKNVYEDVMISIRHSPPKSINVEVNVILSAQRIKKLLLYTRNFWSLNVVDGNKWKELNIS